MLHFAHLHISNIVFIILKVNMFRSVQVVN